MTERILCFGDSQTWGWKPNLDGIHFSEANTCDLAKALAAFLRQEPCPQ